MNEYQGLNSESHIWLTISIAGTLFKILIPRSTLDLGATISREGIWGSRFWNSASNGSPGEHYGEYDRRLWSSVFPTTVTILEAVTCSAPIQADTQSSYCLNKTAPSQGHHFRERWTPRSQPKWFFQ